METQFDSALSAFKWIDTHCHFDLAPFNQNYAAAFLALQNAQVEKIIVPAVCAQSFSAIQMLAQNHASVYMALGLHPLFKHDEIALSQLAEQLAQAQKCVAIGEIGLDFFDKVALKTEQEARLHQQIELAQDFDLPVILHTRAAQDRLLKLIKQYPKVKGVLHAFSGSLQQAQAWVDLGYFIGVGGLITYERAQKTRKTIAALPNSALVLETDAPYMPLSGYQGQANRPERIALIFAQLAQLKGFLAENALDLAQQIYQNSLTCFPKLDFSSKSE